MIVNTIVLMRFRVLTIIKICDVDVFILNMLKCFDFEYVELL